MPPRAHLNIDKPDGLIAHFHIESVTGHTVGFPSTAQKSRRIFVDRDFTIRKKIVTPRTKYCVADPMK